MNDRKRASCSSSEAASSTKKQALTSDGRRAVGHVESAISLHTNGGEKEAEKSGAKLPKKLTVRELRTQLELLGELKTGLKAELVRRLEDAISAKKVNIIRVHIHR
jgi:hypothetical protein